MIFPIWRYDSFFCTIFVFSWWTILDQMLHFGTFDPQTYLENFNFTSHFRNGIIHFCKLKDAKDIDGFRFLDSEYSKSSIASHIVEHSKSTLPYLTFCPVYFIHVGLKTTLPIKFWSFNVQRADAAYVVSMLFPTWFSIFSMPTLVNHHHINKKLTFM